MNLKLTKMQGTGNDYILANLLDVGDSELFNKINWSQMAIHLSDRHFGIGSDGLILICPSNVADCRMRMFNADGSEGAMCGNGIRCLGKYVYERNLIKKTIIYVETVAGIRTLYLDIEGEHHVRLVSVDMGIPILLPTVEIDSFLLTPVLMGNPHVVYFVPSPLSEYPVEKWGPFLECHPRLKERSNVEFVQVVSPNRLRLRIWERGSGETLSCGTGACAAAVCTIQKKGVKSKVFAEVPGGTLTISWKGKGESVFLSGPAEFVFDVAQVLCMC